MRRKREKGRLQGEFWLGLRWRVLATGVHWAQVAERLMAADCKSAAPWSYGGSNPPLCTIKQWLVNSG